MCGIAGAFSFNSSEYSIDEKLLISMRDEMVHRGPDGAGLWISDNKKIGLAHRRLSIIDLSEKATQPMASNDGDIVISFNGEIYNHKEIRKELIDKGYKEWKTDHSDTEVIIYAYKEWGIDFLHKLRGMFAIAIWDNNIDKLYLVRDRIGVKPLYYSFHSGRVTFASEIKALLKDPQQKRAVNEEAFYHYLSFLTTPAPNTLFEGIKKLEGGTYIEIDNYGESKVTRWWDVWDEAGKEILDNDEKINDVILKELKTAVQYRKESDVPVGVFLSGGIDSSTNAALFSEGESSQVKTFSIGYDSEYGSYKNELHYAKEVADFVGAQYFEKKLNIDDLLNFLDEMVYLQDEPIADPVCMPVYYVSKLARDNGVIVCQVGEGADEIFWGYETWKTLLKLQKKDNLPVPKFIKKLLLKYMELRGTKKSLPYEWLRRGSEGLPVFWSGAESFTESHKKELLSERLKEKFKDYTSWEAIKPIRERFEKNAWEKSDLNWMSYVDLNLRLPELLLMRVDKMSMGVSLECRVPFLDHVFVEKAMSIPEKIKTKKQITKTVLKKAVRGIIPDKIIDRKKQGFGVPVHEWFLEKLGDKMKKEILDFCDDFDFFNKKEIEELIEKQYGTQMWFIYNFVLWHRKFIEGINK